MSLKIFAGRTGNPSAHLSDFWSRLQQGQLPLLSQRLLQKPWCKNGFNPSIQKNVPPPPKVASRSQKVGIRTLHSAQGEGQHLCGPFVYAVRPAGPTSGKHLPEKNSCGLLLCWRTWTGTRSCNYLLQIVGRVERYPYQ